LEIVVKVKMNAGDRIRKSRKKKVNFFEKAILSASSWKRMTDAIARRTGRRKENLSGKRKRKVCQGL